MRRPIPAARSDCGRRRGFAHRAGHVLSRLLLIPCLWATAGSPVRAADETPPGIEPTIAVLTTTGERLSGRWTSINAGGDVTIAGNDGKERVVPFDQVVKLTREGAPPGAAPEAAIVIFPDGDRLHRTSIGGATETHLDVQSYALGTVSVPLDSLIGLIFTLPQEAEAVHASLARVREESRTSEVLWLANNDRLPIGLLGLTDKAINYQADRRKQTIERSRVAALGFDPKLVAYPKPEAGFYELTLTDGSRLGLSEIRLEKGHLRAKTRFGAAIRAPLTEVSALHSRGPAVVYLAERTPAREINVPYVGPARPMRRNLTVDGLPLRMMGVDHERGLGMASRTLIAYRLEPGDARFQAIVGLDDRAGPLGGASFRVLVDGKERFASPKMSTGDRPAPVDIDVTGGKLLILITEYGDRGGVRDLGDWVEARIIRQPNR